MAVNRFRTACSALAVSFCFSGAPVLAGIGFEIELSGSRVTSVWDNGEPRDTYIKEEIFRHGNWIVSTDDVHTKQPCLPQVKTARRCDVGLIEIKNLRPIPNDADELARDFRDLLELYESIFQSCGRTTECDYSQNTQDRNGDGVTYHYLIDTSVRAGERVQINIDVPLSAFTSSVGNEMLRTYFDGWGTAVGMADRQFRDIEFDDMSDDMRAKRRHFLRLWTYYVEKLVRIGQTRAKKNELNPNLKFDMCDLARVGRINFDVKSSSKTVRRKSEDIGDASRWRRPFSAYRTARSGDEETECRWTTRDVSNIPVRGDASNPLMVFELRFKAEETCFELAEIFERRQRLIKYNDEGDTEIFRKIGQRIPDMAKRCSQALP